MGYSYICGEIKGISKGSFELIKKVLEKEFDLVKWNNRVLTLESDGEHCDAIMFPIYDKIASCIDEDGGGDLRHGVHVVANVVAQFLLAAQRAARLDLDDHGAAAAAFDFLGELLQGQMDRMFRVQHVRQSKHQPPRRPARVAVAAAETPC